MIVLDMDILVMIISLCISLNVFIFAEIQGDHQSGKTGKSVKNQGIFFSKMKIREKSGNFKI